MGKHEEDVVKRWLTTVKGSADQRWPGMLENWHADATLAGARGPGLDPGVYEPRSLW